MAEKDVSDLVKGIYLRLAVGECRYYKNECDPDTCLRGRSEEGVCKPKDGKINVMLRAACAHRLIADEISKKYSINKK